MSITTNVDQANRLRSHYSVSNRPQSLSNFQSEENTSISSTDIWEALMSIHESRDRPSILLGIPSLTNNIMSNGVRIVRVSSGIEDQYLYEEEVNSSEANVSNDSNDFSQSSANNSQSPSYEDAPSLPEHVVVSEMDTSNEDSSSTSNYRGSSVSREAQTIIIVGPRNANNPLQRIVKNKHNNQIPPNHRIHQNKLRLTHYIEETNAGKGFIKELGFSQDGRVICSPFSYGVRLLAFNESCSELSTCVPNKTPMPLYEIGTSTAHSDIVLCTKFSPRHCLLVSGCHSGNIIWYQPVL